MYASFNNPSFQKQSNFQKALEIGSERVRQKLEQRELNGRGAGTETGASGSQPDKADVRGQLKSAIRSDGSQGGKSLVSQSERGPLTKVYDSVSSIKSNFDGLNTTNITSSELQDFSDAISSALQDIQSSSLYETEESLSVAENELLQAQTQLTNLDSSGLIDDLATQTQQLAVDQGELAQHDVDAALQLAEQDALIDETNVKISDLESLTTALQSADSNLDAMSGDMSSFLDANAPGITSTETVNTSTAGDQQNSSITELSDGSYVVTYESDSIDGGSAGLAAQMFDADGNAVGDEILVASGAVDDVTNANVVAMQDGGFTVLFDKDNDIYGQRFDADGATVGSQFVVNTATGGAQSNVSVTSLDDGGFVAIYEDVGNRISAQRFDADGNAVGSEFDITNPSDKATYAEVIGLDGGGFAVSYTGKKTDEKFVKVFDSEANEISETKFSTNGIETEASSMMALEGGGFALAYVEDNGAQGQDVYVQQFDASGSQVGSAVQVNNTTAGDQGSVGLTALADGGYVVSYTSSDPSDDNLYAQRFDSAGAKTGDEIVISDAGGDQSEASIVGTGDGFFVSYTSDDSDKDIMLARYTGLQNEPKIAAINSELSSIDSSLGSMDVDADNLYATAQDAVDRLNSTISELDSMSVLVEADRESLRSQLVAERDALNAFLGNGYNQSMDELDSELTQRQTDRDNLETSLNAQRLVLASDVATSQAAVDSTTAQIDGYEENVSTALQSTLRELNIADASAKTASKLAAGRQIKLDYESGSRQSSSAEGPSQKDFVEKLLNGELNVLDSDVKFHISANQAENLTLEMDRSKFVELLAVPEEEQEHRDPVGNQLHSRRVDEESPSLARRISDNEENSPGTTRASVMGQQAETEDAVQKTEIHRITHELKEQMKGSDSDALSRIHELRESARQQLDS